MTDTATIIKTGTDSAKQLSQITGGPIMTIMILVFFIVATIGLCVWLLRRSDIRSNNDRDSFQWGLTPLKNQPLKTEGIFNDRHRHDQNRHG